MTSIPTAHSGGGELRCSYSTNDQVETVTQDGVSRTYTLDAAGHHRKLIPGGWDDSGKRLHYRDGSAARQSASCIVWAFALGSPEYVAM